MNKPGHESDKLHIERYDRTTPTLPGKPVTNLTDISFAGTPPSPSRHPISSLYPDLCAGLIWDRESRSVIADADVSARHVLFAVDMYVNQSVPYDAPNKVLPMLTPLAGTRVPRRLRILAPTSTLIPILLLSRTLTLCSIRTSPELSGSSSALVMQPGTNNFVYQFNSMMAPTDLYIAAYSFQGYLASPLTPTYAAIHNSEAYPL